MILTRGSCCSKTSSRLAACLRIGLMDNASGCILRRVFSFAWLWKHCSSWSYEILKTYVMFCNLWGVVYLLWKWRPSRFNRKIWEFDMGLIYNFLFSLTEQVFLIPKLVKWFSEGSWLISGWSSYNIKGWVLGISYKHLSCLSSLVWLKLVLFYQVYIGCLTLFIGLRHNHTNYC